jgi:hypothetical protein
VTQAIFNATPTNPNIHGNKSSSLPLKDAIAFQEDAG